MDNIHKYKNDIDSLITNGKQLRHSLLNECSPRFGNRNQGESFQDAIRQTRSFRLEYQLWYSEAKTLVEQLLPNRLADFVRYYASLNKTSGVAQSQYTIEDYLRDSNVNEYDISRQAPKSAMFHFEQQIGIVESIQKRLKSSLFDIHALVQANLFDSELEAASEISKNGFYRAGGVIAGVVLERHLKEVCITHKISLKGRNPQLSSINNSLKNAGVVDISQWRFIQHLGDLRNICAHDSEQEPTKSHVNDLIEGVKKVIKTIF